MTVTGQTIGAKTDGAQVWNDDVIRKTDDPLYAEGALVVPRGNLAPGGRPPKTAAGEETGGQAAAPANRQRPQPLQATLLGRIAAVGPSNFDLLGTDQVVILQHEPGGLRLHDLHGGLICETRELHGQPLQHPRGLVIEEDGSLTVFDGYSELPNGRIEDAITTESNESLELTGPFAHPRRSPTPVLQPQVLVLDFAPRLSLPGGAVARGAQ